MNESKQLFLYLSNGKLNTENQARLKVVAYIPLRGHNNKILRSKKKVIIKKSNKKIIKLTILVNWDKQLFDQSKLIIYFKQS